MTVERIAGDVIHCVWFIGTRVIRDSFRRDRLQRS